MIIIPENTKLLTLIVILLECLLAKYNGNNQLVANTFLMLNEMLISMSGKKFSLKILS